MTDSKKRIICIAFVFWAAIASHLTTLAHDFVLDDFRLIVMNDFITHWGNSVILFDPRYLFNPYPIKCGARPLTVLSLMLDYKFWQLNPFGYHLTNILLHGMNTVAVFVLTLVIIRTFRKAHDGVPYSPPDLSANKKSFVDRLALNLTFSPAIFWIKDSSVQNYNNRYGFAVCAALVFALHPLQAEAVNIPSFRADLLATFFYCMALIFFLKAIAASRLPALAMCVSAVAAFVLGLFSKEIVITLPALFLCIVLILFNKRISKIHLIIISAFGLCSVLFLMFFWSSRFIYPLYSVVYPNTVNNVSPLSSISAYLNTILLTFLHTVQVLILPVTLSIDYQIDISRSLLTFQPMLAVLVLLLLLAVTVLTKDSLLRLGIGFSLLSYLPVSNIIPLVNTVNDRYAYLPLIGFSLVAVHMLFNGWQEKRVGWVPVKLAVAVMGIMFLSAITLIRNPIFQDSYALYSDVVKHAPGNVRVRYNLGLAYMVQDRYTDALREFEKTVQANPFYKRDDVWYLMGNCYEELHDQAKAEEYYGKSILLNPKREVIRKYTGVLLQAGAIDDALWIADKTVQVSADAYSCDTLGSCYMQKKDYRNAVRYFRASIDSDPRYTTAWYHLLQVYKISGNTVQYEKEINRMIALFSEKGWLKDENDEQNPVLAGHDIKR